LSFELFNTGLLSLTSNFLPLFLLDVILRKKQP
jgi:hypothetical protein